MNEFTLLWAVAIVLALFGYVLSRRRRALRRKIEAWKNKVRAKHPNLVVTDVGDDLLAEHAGSVLTWSGDAYKNFEFIVGGNARVQAHVRKVKKADPSRQSTTIFRLEDIKEMMIESSNHARGGLLETSGFMQIESDQRR